MIDNCTPHLFLGEPFACDLCNSRYVCNPSRKGNQARRSKHQPSPRYKEDAETGKLLVLCNACGKICINL